MRVAIEDILKVYDQQILDNLFLQKNPNSQSNAWRLRGGSGGVALLNSCAIPKLLDVVKHTPFVSLNNIGSAVSPSQTLWRKNSRYINVSKDATVLGRRIFKALDSVVKGIGTTALPKQKEHWSAVTTLMKLKINWFGFWSSAWETKHASAAIEVWKISTGHWMQHAAFHRLWLFCFPSLIHFGNIFTLAAASCKCAGEADLCSILSGQGSPTASDRTFSRVSSH